MKTKTFTIGKYQAIVSIREGLYYPLTCVLTHIPTNTEKYVIEHKTAQDIRDQELLIKLFEGYNVWMCT